MAQISIWTPEGRRIEAQAKEYSKKYSGDDSVCYPYLFGMLLGMLTDKQWRELEQITKLP